MVASFTRSAALPPPTTAHPKCFLSPALSQTPVLAGQPWFRIMAVAEHGTQRLQGFRIPDDIGMPRRSEMTRPALRSWAKWWLTVPYR